MRLLYDQNLSPRLVDALADLFPGPNVFPGSQHVSEAGLDRATDLEIIEYARSHFFAIVTKDADFSELMTAHVSSSETPRPYPKIIWIQRGNCSTREIEQLIRENAEAIRAIEEDFDVVTLALG